MRGPNPHTLASSAGRPHLAGTPTCPHWLCVMSWCVCWRGVGGVDVACPGLSGTALALVAADNKLEHYVKVLKSNGALLFAAKFFVTAPVVYHYVGGLRHLVRYTF